jgi:hypothetical protein
MLEIFNPKRGAIELLKFLKTTKASILPFIEYPAVNKEKAGIERKENEMAINATELFSLFTASIIKEEVVFTR